ncbi:MAG: hypothetical protein ACI8XB_003198 [Patiriisocius sp.]|jgi:hypothetical protein
MIKFFRKIRKRLLTENRFSKYFLYALGEILLVVIGILIAIQLNEWRNDMVNSQQKDKVLQALQFEFQSNLAQLDNVLFQNGEIITAYYEVMRLIKTVDEITDDSRLQFAHMNLGNNWSFDPINGALRSGISSGEIHLIDNDRLLDLLFSWEDVVNDSKEESLKQRAHQTKSTDFLQKYIRIGDLWSSYFPGSVLSHYPSDVRGLYKDVQFEDYTSFSFALATEYERELKVIRTNNVEILELIEEEIKKGA